MRKILITLTGIELSLLLLFLGWMAFVVPHLQNPLPRIEWADDSKPDAREVASALATPPAHLHDPFWQRLYHWQSLIAGLLAFAGGLGALGAAFVGANAIREQTRETAQATRDAAEQQVKAMRCQSADALDAVQKQIKAEHQKAEAERDFKKKENNRLHCNAAQAMSAELDSLVDIIDKFEMIKFYRNPPSASGGGLIIAKLYPFPTNFPIFHENIREIGSLPGVYPHTITEVYMLAFRVRDVINSISIHEFTDGQADSFLVLAKRISEDLYILRNTAKTAANTLRSYAAAGGE
ncbi:hypothetical protein [Azospirillum argentinense]|uniref:hypothetical protein n=1 Tax=Azospirillum argentinense TaxID=2970906 RepID=UPI0010C0F65F|nr:hypothetical protein [Azospirillum argentinense]